MGKYTELSEENKKLFNEVLNETSIPHHIIIETLGNDKQKRDACKINKGSDILETLTDGINFIVTINEGIFDELSDTHKKIALHESIAGISYNSERDSIKNEKADVTKIQALPTQSNVTGSSENKDINDHR